MSNRSRLSYFLTFVPFFRDCFEDLLYRQNISMNRTKKHVEQAQDLELDDVKCRETVRDKLGTKRKESSGDTALQLFDDVNDEEPYTEAEEGKLMREIDWMILPYVAVCYAFFYIDKTTLSYAAIFGIREDLNLHGTQYNWLSSIFYFGFLVYAIPTNYMLQRFPVAKYLGINIFAWGALLMCQAAARNFQTLAALRALSGAAESCSDPAFMLITSFWYDRRQQPVRIGLWYTANGLGIALGGLLGYGIGHIGGALSSWKYEFLIIGALCCVWGIVLILFLPDSPVTAKSLSPRQRRIIVERTKEDQTGVENKTFKPYQVAEAALDYKTYLFFLLGVVGNIPNGGKFLQIARRANLFMS